MAKPTSRQEFKEYCLRSLGKGAVVVNVTEDQIDDRVDEAISYYQDYHYAGQRDEVLLHEVTALDIANRYFVAPEGIVGIGNVYSTGLDYTGFSNFMTAQYQIRFEDVITASTQGITSYFISKTALETYRHILSPKIRYRFNPNDRKVHLDFDWNQKAGLGKFILYEARMNVNPDTETQMWGNRVLQKLQVAYIKRQWGENLKKFVGTQMAGGVQLNADQILQSALEDIQKLEEDFILKYQMPDDFMVG